MRLSDDLTKLSDQELANWHAEAKGRPEHEILAEQEWKKRLISSSPQTTKQWYEKPLGIVLLMAFGGLIVGYLIYYLGWN